MLLIMSKSIWNDTSRYEIIKNSKSWKSKSIWNHNNIIDEEKINIKIGILHKIAGYDCIHNGNKVGSWFLGQRKERKRGNLNPIYEKILLDYYPDFFKERDGWLNRKDKVWFQFNLELLIRKNIYFSYRFNSTWTYFSKIT